jgi:hypothetical protein
MGYLLLLVVGIGQVVVQTGRSLTLGEYSLIVINGYLIVSTIVGTSCLCEKLFIAKLRLTFIGKKVKDKG